MRIEEIELHTAPDEFIERYLDFQELIHNSYYSTDIQQERETRRVNIRLPPSKKYTKNYFAFENEEIIGQGNFTYQLNENETNPDHAEIYIEIHPDHLHQGYSKKLLKLLAKEALENKKSKIETYSRSDLNSEVVTEYINKLGGKRTQIERQNRLYKETVNWDYINDTKNKYQEIENNFQFVRMDKHSRHQRIVEDDAFTAENADFYTSTVNLIPREDSSRDDEVITAKDVKERAELGLKSSWNSDFYYLMEGDKIIGFSGLHYPNEDPVKWAGTGLTAVRKEYQGRGIASFLKVKVTEYMFKTFPELVYINTENNNTNQAMIHINEKLGYKEIYQWWIFEIPLEGIQAFLQQN